MNGGYDFLIAGAGLFGSVFAHEMTKAGKRCLVAERRDAVGGNIRCKDVDGIPVHLYGAHIFHTDDEEVWRYVNAAAPFHAYVNAPIADYRGKLFHLPFNMNTFYALWGAEADTPEKARRLIERKTAPFRGAETQNLEEKALSLVGEEIYETLIKGYTEKQWGRSARDLPPFIIGRLPLRFTFDNNYFDNRFQGIPDGGYNGLIEMLLEGADVLTDTAFIKDGTLRAYADRVLYTGMLDAYYGFEYGSLDYRSLRFETVVEECANAQGVAVKNFTDAETPYTRIIEHKHFDSKIVCGHTVLTREYPQEYCAGREPYYPINDARNEALYRRYRERAEREGLLIGGRLGLYRYMDMDKTVRAALDLSAAVLSGQK